MSIKTRILSIVAILLCSTAQPVHYTKLFTLAFEGKTEELKQELQTLKQTKSSAEFNKLINEQNKPHLYTYDHPWYGEEELEKDHEHNYLTALDGAIVGNHKDAFQLLLSNGADVNAPSLPLLQATKALPNTFFIEELIKHNAHNGYDRMLLAFLQSSGTKEMFENLLKHRVELVEQKMVKAQSPVLVNLFAHGQSGRSFIPLRDLIPLLMKYGFTLNEIAEDDAMSISKRNTVSINNMAHPTVLHNLIEYYFNENLITIVRLLLENGADPSIPDRFGRTLLQKVEKRSTYDIAKELWNYEGTREERNEWARHNCDKVKALLLEYGAK